MLFFILARQQRLNLPPNCFVSAGTAGMGLAVRPHEQLRPQNHSEDVPYYRVIGEKPPQITRHNGEIVQPDPESGFVNEFKRYDAGLTRREKQDLHKAIRLLAKKKRHPYGRKTPLRTKVALKMNTNAGGMIRHFMRKLKAQAQAQSKKGKFKIN